VIDAQELSRGQIHEDLGVSRTDPALKHNHSRDRSSIEQRGVESAIRGALRHILEVLHVRPIRNRHADPEQVVRHTARRHGLLPGLDHMRERRSVNLGPEAPSDQLGDQPLLRPALYPVRPPVGTDKRMRTRVASAWRRPVVDLSFKASRCEAVERG